MKTNFINKEKRKKNRSFKSTKLAEEICLFFACYFRNALVVCKRITETQRQKH